MKEYQYEISDEPDCYRVRAILRTDSRDGKHDDLLGEAVIKHGVLRDDDDDYRYEMVKKGDDPLKIYAVFEVNKSELQHEFDDIKEDMDEIVERAQGKYWDALEYAGKFLSMLKVAKELNILPEK